MARPPKRSAWQRIEDLTPPDKNFWSDVLSEFGNALGSSLWDKIKASSATKPKADPNDPYDILGVRRGFDLNVYKAIFRERSKKAHPDAGGSPEEMARLTDAMRRIEEEMNKRG